MQIDQMEMLLAGKHGFEFQNYCERYLAAKYGADFCRVAPDGRNGDGGKDGYCESTGMYFAISSNEKIANKIRYDFNSCIAKNKDVKIFVYVTNRPVRAKDWAVVQGLQQQNPDFEIRILTHKAIAADLFDFPKSQLRVVLGRDVDLGDNMIFFEEDELKRINFTFRQSIRDSMHFYMFMFVISLAAISVSYVLYSNRLAWNAAMAGLFCAVFLYLVYNKDSIKLTKYPHRIFYYILTDRLPVGGEILFDEHAHRTISRNTKWDFTFKIRSADCAKQGCSCKVYIYRSEDQGYIGKCEKDKINHLYRVDNNFYGDAL